MAHDISAIRSQAIERQSPSLRIKDPRTILSVRTEQLQKDPDVQNIVGKMKTVKRLQQTIKTQQVVLEGVKNATKQTLQSANEEADRLVGETKKKASELIAQAKNDVAEAASLLEQNKRKQKELSDLDESLKIREESVQEQGKALEKEASSLKSKRENVDEMLKSASETKQKTVEIFSVVASLFESFLEQFENFQKSASELPFETSQTFQKAVKMMGRAEVLVKSFDSDKALLSKKAKELQERQELLTDREQMLDRTAKEVEHKIKQI